MTDRVIGCTCGVGPGLQGHKPNCYGISMGVTGVAVAAAPRAMPWHGCLITFMVRNAGFAQDINLHPELPKGWMLFSSERMGKSDFYKLEFEVEGLVNVQDGDTVKRIIEELGM